MSNSPPRHPERSEGSRVFCWRSLATLGMTEGNGNVTWGVTLINIGQALVLSGLLLVYSPAWAAEDKEDAAQQALQQLRMLQNRFMDKKPAKAESGPRLPVTPSPEEVAKEQEKAALNKMAQLAQAEQEKQAINPETSARIIQEQAFQGMAQQLFPLSPKEIKKLHKIYEEQKLAEAASADAPPTPTASSQFVNLSPGSTPPVIRLAQGFVSSLVFLDSTGAPWPITAYDLGDPTAFNIQWDHTSNTLMIQATKLYNYGNLAVRLKNLNTPVMLTLVPGQRAVDYRVDLRIQGTGPNAKGLIADDKLPANANDILLHVLDGVPPEGGQRLNVNGGDALAWLFKNKMYVRTNLTILSPGWLASMTSADGMHAYEMMKSPVLLVSWHGKVMQLIVEGL